MLRLALLAVLLSTGLAARAAAQDHHANDDEARRVFEAGTHEFDAGRYEQALALFDHAYAMSQRGGLLYNVGLCHDRLGHDREALDAFRRFLAADPSTTHRTEVEVRIRALEAAVARADAAAASQAQTTTVPTPDETAHATETHAQANVLPVQPPPPEHHGSVLEEWWLWTIIGVAIAGGVVAAVLIADANRGTEMPISPVNGLFTALEVP